MENDPGTLVGRRCRLQQTIGVDEACPEAGCALWEPGGAVVDGRCAIEQIDLSDRPELARWLLEIRRTLETAEDAKERGVAHSRLAQLLNDAEE